MSVLPCVGRRNSLEERSVQPSISSGSSEYEDDVESNAPSSPRSEYPDEESVRPGQSTASQSYLCSSSPFGSYSELRPCAVTELRITDNSHSQSNPSQRKKGGCKSVHVTVHLPSSGQSYVVAAKCDVRKSFSNRSFSKYYNRGPYAVIPVTRAGDVVLVVEEAKRGRDGKHFVAMERTCSPPWAADDKRRHPLLAFAADAVYKVSVLTRSGAEEAEVDVKCQFAQGSATVSKKTVTVPAVESRKRSRERVEVEAEIDDGTEAEDEVDNETSAQDAGKRQRLSTPATIRRFDSPLSADSISVVSSPASPFSSTESLVSSPSSPYSPLTSSTASPSPPLSPLPFHLHFHVDHSAADAFMADELELKPSLAAGATMANPPFFASPLLLPTPAWSTQRLSSPGIVAFSPWRSVLWLGEVEELVL